ncbi:MAG: hypothetical protein AAGJ87_14290, partial [Pseudomonadota bacterium]
MSRADADTDLVDRPHTNDKRRRLAALLQQRGDEIRRDEPLAPTQQIDPLPSTAPGSPWPLTPAQRRLLFLQCADPNL